MPKDTWDENTLKRHFYWALLTSTHWAKPVVVCLQV